MRHAYLICVCFSYHRPFGLSWRPWSTICFSRTTKQERIYDTQFRSLVQTPRPLFYHHKTTAKSTLHKMAVVFAVRFSPPVFQHGATSSSLFSQNSGCEYSLQCTSFSSAESGHNCSYRLYFSYHRPFGLSWRPWCTVFFSHTIKQELIYDTQFNWSAPLSFRSNWSDRRTESDGGSEP